MPRVSIAIPVYNGERYLRPAIDSLLAQTFRDFELVISDNASTDATEAICREYVARDPRVRYHRQPRNIGGPGNFTGVFHLCTGEYHKWSTADDYWEPTMVEKCVAVLDRHPDVVLAYPKTRLEDEWGGLLREYHDKLDLQDDSPSARFMKLLSTAGLCHAQLGLIRRKAMLNTGLMGNELASDFRFLAELSLYGKFTVIPEFLFHRRFHADCSSWDRENMEHQRKYYDPEHRRVFGLHTWRRYLHLVAAVTRAPIAGREKVTLYRYLARRTVRDRERLWQEVRAFIGLPVPPPAAGQTPLPPVPGAAPATPLAHRADEAVRRAS